jgi:hypothetical protein
MKFMKYFHKHETSIQILTNFFTIVGVLVATFQISSTRQIIEAIFTSQEKAASYRLLALKTEVQSNLGRIEGIMKQAKLYENLSAGFQIPLSTSVYFSDPTYFKLDHLDKDQNEAFNEKISKIYEDWQIANSLIQVTESMGTNVSANPRITAINILKNNRKILNYLGETLQPAQDVLKALEAESNPT